MENSDGVLAALDHQPVPFPRHAKAGILSPGRPVSQCQRQQPMALHPCRSLIPNDAERMGEGRSGRGKRVPLDQRKEGRKPVRCRTDGRIAVRAWRGRGPWRADVTPSPIRNIPERVSAATRPHGGASTIKTCSPGHYLRGRWPTDVDSPDRPFGVVHKAIAYPGVSVYHSTITENHGIPKNVRCYGTPVPQNPFIARPNCWRRMVQGFLHSPSIGRRNQG